MPGIPVDLALSLCVRCEVPELELFIGAEMVEYSAHLLESDGQTVRADALYTSAEVSALTAKLGDVAHDVVVWHQNRLLVLRRRLKR